MPEECREYHLFELRIPESEEIDWTAVSEAYADGMDMLRVIVGLDSYEELLQKWGLVEEELAEAA